MLTELLLWVVRLFPLFEYENILDQLEPVAGYVAWTGMFLDWPFISNIAAIIVIAEGFISLALFIRSTWENIPGN